jgi:hypothetical protein
MTLLLDIDPHGRLLPQSDETKRMLADRAGRFALLPAAADLLVAVRTPPAGGTAPTPRCVLAGDLSGFPIADLVTFIHQSRISGLLTVSTPGVERSIAFKDGEVRNAQSEAIGERIGEVALRLGYITEPQLGEATRGDRPFGKLLVERGFISPPDLWKCFHEQVTAIFHGILLAREGVFCMTDEPLVDRLGAQLSVNTQALLMDGIRRIDEMTLFRAKIPSLEVYLRQREPHRPITLRSAEHTLLALVDGRRTVAEIAAAAHLNEFDATKTLYHLAEAGYVEASTEPSAATGGVPTARLQAIAGGMNEILRAVCQAATREAADDSFLAGVRIFLVDPMSRFAPIWKRLVPTPDGTLDEEKLLGNLAALRGTALLRLEPSGDPARLLFDALRELMFFYLFQAGERLPRQVDDTLGKNVKRSFEALEALR